MRTKDALSQPGPPASAEEVIARLTAEFDGLSAQLQRAARHVIDHPREVGVRSMRALAAQAEVRPNTLVRLAQAIEFEGYEALRERFRDFVAEPRLGGFGDRARWLRAMHGQGGAGAVLAEMASAVGENVDGVWRKRPADEIARVADAILEARRVFVLGVGAAHSLAHQFWYVGRMAFDHLTPIPAFGGRPVDDMGDLGAEDALLAITFQPYRSETMAAARAAKAAGAKVLGLTDSPTSPLAKLSDALLIAPTHTPHFFQSQAAAIAILEGLIAVLVSRAGEDAAARIEAFHRRRLEAGIYEEPAALAALSLGEGPQGEG